MKITRIRDAVAPIPSPMRNAVISFDRMTISMTRGTRRSRMMPGCAYRPFEQKP